MRVGHGSESRPASPADERVFPAGRFFRRFSLDELPQLINVIRGEMSLVGPRPHMVRQNEQFAKVLQKYHVRALVKPGMTGLAQVRGFRGEPRTTDDIAARVESDVVYLENWSPVLDLAIMARTLVQVIWPPKSAH
jgi:putative colanic acid biosynthesis UDP-glucose lipid carrier transferase